MRGKARVDDRRVISGIVHVLKSGGRWIDAPADYGPRKTLYNRCTRWARRGVWIAVFEAIARAGGPSGQVLIDSSAVKAHRSASGGKRGEKPGYQPLARWPDDENPRLTDAECRPIAVMLTGGQVPDCVAGEVRIEHKPDARLLNGDKGHDANAIHRQVEARGVMPNIPPKANRRWKNCVSAVLYRNRNAIERMFCRLKDFRREATP